VVVDKVEGAVLVDHIKSVDLEARNVKFHSRADPALLNRVRGYVGVLLHIPVTGCLSPNSDSRIAADQTGSISDDSCCADSVSVTNAAVTGFFFGVVVITTTLTRTSSVPTIVRVPSGFSA